MKAPKEIYLLGQDLEFMVNDGMHELYFVDVSLTDVLGGQIKYLSEESVNEMLEALEDVIVQNNKDARFREERLETVLAEKDGEIIALKEQIHQWISVEDSLPTNCTNVLIVSSEGVNEAYYEKKRFYTENGSEYNYVTYWMPLPKQP